ncbi:hypothetical protein GCM10020254_62790 [Streptomyces goshikiensis]
MRSSHPRSAAVAALVASALATGLLAGSADAAEGAVSADPIRIHDIQGTTRISPLVGKQVADVEGIVTGVRTYGSRGFWMQDPDADGNDATSEGVFVFTNSVPTVAVGDAVKVSGLVGEYVPGGAASGNQSVTQISKPAVTVVSSGNALPEATAINEYTVPAAYAPAGDPAAAGSINGLTLEPSRYALDYYEALEGMNVRIGTSRVVGATDPYAELWVTVKGWENTAKRGGTIYGSYESQNTGRLQIQQLAPLAQQPFPVANVGDKLTGTTEGPLDFNQFGGYTLVARTLGTVKAGTIAPREDQGAGGQRARGGHVQRGEPRPDRPAGEVRQPGQGRRREPRLPRCRRPGGDPGRQRRQERRHRLGRADPDEVHGGDHGRGRPRLPVADRQPGEQQGRRRARRQHPPGVPVQPGAGLLHRARPRATRRRRPVSSRSRARPP